MVWSIGRVIEYYAAEGENFDNIDFYIEALFNHYAARFKARTIEQL